MNKQRHSHSIISSFQCAFSGLFRAIWHERNVRVHIILACVVLYFSSYYDLAKSDYAVLIAVIGLVISLELLNTAIESAVDLATTEYHRFAKIAKDTAAAAVLFAAVISVVVAFVLFYDTQILAQIWHDVAANWFRWALTIAFGIVLIIAPDLIKTKKLS